jgi:hypothetical protein
VAAAAAAAAAFKMVVVAAGETDWRPRRRGRRYCPLFDDMTSAEYLWQIKRGSRFVASSLEVQYSTGYMTFEKMHMIYMRGRNIFCIYRLVQTSEWAEECGKIWVLYFQSMLEINEIWYNILFQFTIQYGTVRVVYCTRYCTVLYPPVY